MKKFKEYLDERIIVPELDTYFSKDLMEMKKHYKNIIFDDSIKQIAHYNTKTKEMKINFSKIKNKQDFFQVIFHESIHMLQDKKTLININKILFNEKINKREIRNKLFFLGQFEIMAYASTVALRLIFEGKTLNDLSEIMNTRFKIIQELIQNKKFKKYIYLYYREFKKEKYFNIFNIYDNLNEGINLI